MKAIKVLCVIFLVFTAIAFEGVAALCDVLAGVCSRQLDRITL